MYRCTPEHRFGRNRQRMLAGRMIEDRARHDQLIDPGAVDERGYPCGHFVAGADGRILQHMIEHRLRIGRQCRAEVGARRWQAARTSGPQRDKGLRLRRRDNAAIRREGCHAIDECAIIRAEPRLILDRDDDQI